MLKYALPNFLSFILIFFIICSSIILWGKFKFEEPQNLQLHNTFIVNPGDSFDVISQNLHDKRIIKNQYIFKIGVVLTKNQKKLKYGEYEFPKTASMSEIANIIANGETKLHKLVIPEGFSNWQIIERLNAQELLVGDITAEPMEGTLAPQTYLFSRGEKRSALLSRMLKNQEMILEKEWLSRAEGLPLKNISELLILASIIEEEASIADEREIIASVFIKRLEKKMKLQTDPTVIYGITRGKYKLGRGLLLSELKKFSPWNTYKIDGLPPTPISNPGLASIKAATNPSKTDFLYFVSNGKGGHVFAKSYEKHLKNVTKWRKIEKQLKSTVEH